MGTTGRKEIVMSINRFKECYCKGKGKDGMVTGKGNGVKRTPFFLTHLKKNFIEV